jgi:hypothetical protein
MSLYSKDSHTACAAGTPCSRSRQIFYSIILTRFCPGVIWMVARLSPAVILALTVLCECHWGSTWVGRTLDSACWVQVCYASLLLADIVSFNVEGTHIAYNVASYLAQGGWGRGGGQGRKSQTNGLPRWPKGPGVGAGLGYLIIRLSGYQ